MEETVAAPEESVMTEEERDECITLIGNYYASKVNAVRNVYTSQDAACDIGGYVMDEFLIPALKAYPTMVRDIRDFLDAFSQPDFRFKFSRPDFSSIMNYF